MARQLLPMLESFESISLKGESSDASAKPSSHVEKSVIAALSMLFINPISPLGIAAAAALKLSMASA